MPYNTRRKSLSLPSLGIHVPMTHAERAAAAAAAAAASNATLSPSPSTPEQTELGDSATATSRSSRGSPNKRVKRFHSRDSEPVSPGKSRDSTKARDSKTANFKRRHTPPPSPQRRSLSPIEGTDEEDGEGKTVDLEGIGDDVVAAVIVQLQSSANRPHLIKDLATALSRLQVVSVSQSANPCSVISSRVTAYMKRPCWSALAPCPIAKDLGASYPRRTYYFLTTRPRLSFPALSSGQLPSRTVPSPSLSSSEAAFSEEESKDDDLRRALSPSPEIDLSAPDFDDNEDEIAVPTTPIENLSCAPGQFNRSHGSQSPPLERDEREFTQTADGLQKRKLTTETFQGGTETSFTEESQRYDPMFEDRLPVIVNSANSMRYVSSPAFRPTIIPSSVRKDNDTESWLKMGKFLEWDDSPEDIELDELDCLLDAC